ncbi:MAG: hypothetical protein A2651_01915 [Candidatus Yanofskybacteria bacterium RIFCSPHIGHO2_01_FULL_42_12]|uniref:Adenylate kinase n=1 Tax=Candidatus Yanofskybacteria bacterium RIFCSPLOWO2_01_FULL_42_49 TaxID=1802694 RepID=A0A1F8GG87_9BACT|nr:MAG: hypothetical protein A2651_01915 [Candidatus Yanofskybacteria bacterium RIFCSPHIGHO2_01_FULL_42_12]OGN23469.1 MAG: hypothetical protein A2918_00220 [Candidatus Yanofskybacteria bacterium RIFCSPLOWO2_01_FULL_42_49]
MSEENKKWVVILIGPPGSGKGTQAEMLAEKFGLVHLESSKVIEEKIKNADPENQTLLEEKRKWESGQLNTPKLVRRWIIEKIEELALLGKSIVFSGSPRTIFEAEGEISELERSYGKENIKVIHLDLGEHGSVKRNSSRRICEKNRHPIPNFPEYENITQCPKDGSGIIRRVLDNLETVKVRYQVYLKETKPVLDLFEDKGYRIIEINADQFIEKVFKDILEQLDDKN